MYQKCWNFLLCVYYFGSYIPNSAYLTAIYSEICSKYLGWKLFIDFKKNGGVIEVGKTRYKHEKLAGCLYRYFKNSQDLSLADFAIHSRIEKALFPVSNTKLLRIASFLLWKESKSLTESNVRITYFRLVQGIKMKAKMVIGRKGKSQCDYFAIIRCYCCCRLGFIGHFWPHQRQRWDKRISCLPVEDTLSIGFQRQLAIIMRMLALHCCFCFWELLLAVAVVAGFVSDPQSDKNCS